ncbi:MAG: ester cyclase [Candidatus Pelagibacterales bacterium]|jgi:predicted ester cyclase|tara:strand:- start:474 stop:884 length:411 start_codon:yes stop_codon:yes gene_type:complete
MSKEKNIQLIKKLHHIWNTGDINLVSEVYSENIIVNWARGWGLPSKGLKEVEQTILKTRSVFHNWNEEILDLVVDDDKVTSRYISTGVHKEEYLGVPASGKNIEFQEISIYLIRDNKVLEQWCLGDDLHLLSQIKH